MAVDSRHLSMVPLLGIASKSEVTTVLDVQVDALHHHQCFQMGKENRRVVRCCFVFVVLIFLANPIESKTKKQ